MSCETKDVDCPFCEALKKHKEDREYYRRPNDKSVTEYTAALVDRTYLDDYPIGQFTSYGFTLNVCPVCGNTLMEEIYESKNLSNSSRA